MNTTHSPHEPQAQPVDHSAHAAAHPPGPAAGPTPRRSPHRNSEGQDTPSFDQQHPPSRSMAEAVFDPTATFESLGLRDSVVKSLRAKGFERPTKIQGLLIPPMLAGKDLIGQARTGTGKTGAFGLPLLHMCDRGVPTQALVMVPTRELCLQVAEEINTLAMQTPIRACAVFGGERIKTQVDALRRNPEIIVSTPGRLMDMVERGIVKLGNVRFAVLDEVDRMLDIGFREDIRRILKMCPPPRTESTPPDQLARQTVFVSATLPSDVERLIQSHSHNPEKVVAVVEGALTNAQVRQFYLTVQPWDKRRLLTHLLTHEEPALTLVFCRTKRTVDDLVEYLMKKRIDAHGIHGDMMQSRRNKVIEKLHAGELGVLVASDLASRGLDVDGITHVVNYDMPEDPEVYVHRIGRTARVGRDGVAWSLVCPDQGDLLTSVERLINTEVPKLDYPDFKPGPVPMGRVPVTGPNSTTRPAAAQPFNRYAATVNPELPIAGSAPAAATAGAGAANTGASGPATNGDGSRSATYDPSAHPAPVKKAAPTAIDTNKFPGGIVPSKLPPKRMWGKVKS
ncbi:MAG: DEAD/DEAH box helicase [Phycisphaerales bacterium]